MQEWTKRISDAGARIKGHARLTPAVASYQATASLSVALKLEHLQHTASFKVRGAFNTLLQGGVPSAGVVAASGGNHGAAVAYAARQLGIPAQIFVPDIAGPSKIDLIRQTGANLTVTTGEYANALEAALAYERETGAMQIHAYDAPATVTGQGTLFAEWEEQGLDADTILIAVGGGGLIAGALAWFQGRRKVVAVEPNTSCALNAALAAGTPVDVSVSGIAANALGARRIGQICYDLASAQGIASITVPDTAIANAQRQLWQDLRQYVEPAGATALAAITSGAYVPEDGERVAVLVCGANPMDAPEF